MPTSDDLDVRITAQALQLAEQRIEIDTLGKAVNQFVPLAQQVTEVKGTMTTMQKDVERMLLAAEKKADEDRNRMEKKAIEDQAANQSQKRLVWSLGVTLMIGLGGILTAVLTSTGQA